METLKTSQQRLGQFGELTFISYKEFSFTNDVLGENDEMHERYEAPQEAYVLFGYYGYYKPGMNFAESSGRFLSEEELEGDRNAAYLSTDTDKNMRNEILPDGYEMVGDGGCYASMVLKNTNLGNNVVVTSDISCIVAMKDFIHIAGTISNLSIRFSPFNVKDTGAILGILEELFDEAVISPPIGIEAYFTKETFTRLILCAAICLVALINVLHLFLFIVRKAKAEMNIFAICGARKKDLYTFVAYIWTIASLLAFVLSQTLLFAFYYPLSNLELFIMPSFTIYFLGFMVTWLIPYLVCLPVLHKNIDALYV